MQLQTHNVEPSRLLVQRLVMRTPRVVTLVSFGISYSSCHA